jgi:signal transduction histidine kinase
VSLVAVSIPMRPLQLSVDDGAVSRLQEQIASGTCEAVATQQTALAWHLRQRDTGRALALVAATEDLLRTDDVAMRARLKLVRAEARWLAADLTGCEALAREAGATFAAVKDLVGQSDAWAVQAHAALDAGEIQTARRHMRQARALARAARDRDREQGAAAVLAYWSLVDDTDQAEREWASIADRMLQGSTPHVSMWACDFFGQLHARRGRHSEAIAAFSAAFTHAQHSGQVRRAIVASTNVAASFHNLNAHDSALEWIERALKLARPTGWPGSLGLCLMMMGMALLLLQRLDGARQALDEAVRVLQVLPGSRSLLLTQSYRAELALQQGDQNSAAEFAERASTAARQAGMSDIECDAQRALAAALLRQGRLPEARAAADLALQQAQSLGSPTRCIDALLVLAEVHAPQAEPGQGARADLSHLLRALALSDGIGDFIPKPATLETAAREQAYLGEYAQACALVQKANAARDQGQVRAANQRAAAMEARREVDGARAHSQALREHAAAQARREAALQDANATLQRLGALGRDVSAQFDLDQLFQRLYKHLECLLDMQHMSIWHVGRSDGDLHLHFGLELGHRLAPLRVASDNNVSLAARCLRQARELLHSSPGGAVEPSQMPGTLLTLTSLFGPMKVRGLVIGVLSVQSVRPDAYGERERLVFRSACAWAAIALDNAAAVGELEAAHQHLRLATNAERRAREQAEQATQLKGEFFSNISHDLRTPLASLQGYLETLLLEPGIISDADRVRYLGAALAQSAKVNRLAMELMVLAQLESGAMAPALTRFSLSQLVVDVVRKLELAVGGREQRVLVCCSPELPDAMADTGMIERVVTNLLDNAIQHAPPGSEIRIEIGVDADGRLEVTVLDTGPGIPAELRSALFSQPSPVAQAHRPGGGGLGLLIVQRLLQQHGCEIALVQRVGYGAAFKFDVPAAARC